MFEVLLLVKIAIFVGAYEKLLWAIVKSLRFSLDSNLNFIFEGLTPINF